MPALACSRNAMTHGDTIDLSSSASFLNGIQVVTVGDFVFQRQYGPNHIIAGELTSLENGVLVVGDDFLCEYDYRAIRSHTDYVIES